MSEKILVAICKNCERKITWKPSALAYNNLTKQNYERPGYWGHDEFNDHIHCPLAADVTSRPLYIQHSDPDIATARIAELLNPSEILGRHRAIQK